MTETGGATCEQVRPGESPGARLAAYSFLSAHYMYEAWAESISGDMLSVGEHGEEPGEFSYGAP